MSTYQNGCTCDRCRAHGIMGPAILVTLGIQLLLAEMDVISFGRTWPVLFIVIGAVMILRSNASMHGHRELTAYPGYPVAPSQVPPASPGGTAGSNQTGVSNG